jgi:hypothetical protein
MEMKKEAVSESIGYLIIFSLILTGIGLITLYGYPLLMQQQSSANMRNMEQTMVVLQNDLKSLTYKLANYKETALRVSGGSLSLYGPSYTPQNFTIQWNDATFGPQTYTFIPGELRYFSTNDNTVITLENGAVIEKPLSQNGSFMLADPRWYVDTSSKTLVINLMNLSTEPGTVQQLSETGIGTVRTRLLASSIMPPYTPSDSNVFISYYNNSITTDGYSLAWKTYLTNPNGLNMIWQGPLKPSQYKISGINTLIIKEYDIVVETL